MTLRALIATLLALVAGLPLSIIIMGGLARLAGMEGEGGLFMVIIMSSISWALILFSTLWFALRRRKP